MKIVRLSIELKDHPDFFRLKNKDFYDIFVKQKSEYPYIHVYWNTILRMIGKYIGHLFISHCITHVQIIE